MSQSVPVKLSAEKPSAVKLPVVTRSITSDPVEIAPVRRAVEELAVAAGFDPVAVADVGLSVNEALANVVRHAYNNRPAQPIDVRADVTAGTLTVSIRDWGSGVVPDLHRKKSDLATPGGLGLLCLRSMMTGVEYEPQPDGMLLRLTKTLTPAVAPV